MIDNLVRAEVYQHFRDRPGVPTVASCAEALGIEPSKIEAAFRRLAQSRALVLDGNTGEIQMAHPYSAVPTGHTVYVAGREREVNCGWDAIAVLALTGDGTYRAADPLTGEVIEWTARDGRIFPDGVVHFLVPAREFWDDIGYT